MSDTLTIAYVTARREPRWHWFFDSLRRQLLPGEMEKLRMVLVDFYAHEHLDLNWSWERVFERRREAYLSCPIADLVHTPPIWGPWQGPFRKTKDHWTAKSEYLNTAVCFSPGAYLACCDDLSVLGPQWLQAAREACEPQVVTCGAYQKVNDLVVEDGQVVSFTVSEAGKDVRWPQGTPDGPVGSFGNSMFGCSFVVPVEECLKTNGWPAKANGMGFEDTTHGVVLERAGSAFRYDRRMFTYESEELHFVGPRMRSSDYGDSPNDKSHALKALAYDMPVPRWEDNHYNLAKLRKATLAGAPLPVITEPAAEWFTGMPLEDLK